MTVIEKWRQSLDSGVQAAAVVTDLSKAIDCIEHEWLVAKLNVKLNHFYLTRIYVISF